MTGEAGESVASRVRRGGPLSPRAAAGLVAALAAGVHHAHERGLRPAGLGPEDVLLDDEGRPSTGTRPLGDRRRDARAEDVFHLGELLRFLLGGLGPAVPAELSAICLVCVEARPSRRYATADELAAALAAFMSHEPAAPPPRRRRWAVPVAALLLALIAVGAWAVAPTRRGPVAEGPADEEPMPKQEEKKPRPVDPNLGGKRDKAELMEARLVVRLQDRGISPSVLTPRLRPIMAGSPLRVEVSLSRPGHVYLAWIDGGGRVSPIHPWRAGDVAAFRRSAPVMKASDKVDVAFLAEGAGGLATVLLLARDRPFAPEARLPALLGDLPPSPLGEGPAAVYLGLNDRFAVRRLGGEGPLAPDGPVEKVMRELGEYFDVVQAVRAPVTRRGFNP